jgi:hypothetical protein
MESLTITLAGKPYTVSQLTLGQLRDLSIGVTLPDTTEPQDVVRRSFDRAVAVISAALIGDHPDMTAEVLYTMRITRAEMRAANEAVLRFSGLLPAADAPSGEAAGAESTGPS